jgi:hypothetical protein
LSAASGKLKCVALALISAAEPPTDIAEPAIHSVDAIVVAVTGETDAVIEEPAQATERSPK